MCLEDSLWHFKQFLGTGVAVSVRRTGCIRGVAETISQRFVQNLEKHKRPVRL